jgi:Do/DeqQ family serine protease
MLGLNRWVLIVTMILTASSANAALPAHDGNGRALPTLAPMLQKVNDAVVNIATYSTRQAAVNPLLNDPFFRRFFNLPDSGEMAPRQERRQQSAGSGVIVDAAAGTVITNYHVIKGADEVQVSLVDGRVYEAEIKGVDPELDIAVLAIDADKLTQVTLGDSSALQVGDFVVAIGNPFGLGQTVTTGIVSALGRSGLGIEGYENFIQTDASINPGNSGGALVDLNGRLIGINTAIIAPSGGNVGIGFAIPVNMAQASMRQILKHGEVRRGQLGVGIQELTAELREALGMANGRQGVLITAVSEGSTAEQAGLETGDVVISVDGAATRSIGELRSQIGIHEVGDQVAVGVWRQGREQTLHVLVGGAEEAAASDSLHPLLDGAAFRDAPERSGVVVTALAAQSQAAYSGLRVDDVIIGANKRKVSDLRSFRQALSLSRRSVLLHVNRGGRLFYLVLR